MLHKLMEYTIVSSSVSAEILFEPIYYGTKTCRRQKGLRQNVGDKMFRHQNILVPKRSDAEIPQRKKFHAKTSVPKHRRQHFGAKSPATKL